MSSKLKRKKLNTLANNVSLKNYGSTDPNQWSTTPALPVLDPVTPSTVLEKLGDAKTAIVEWSVPNHEVVDASTVINIAGSAYYYVALQAYHVSGIQLVEFSLNNGPFTPATFGDSQFDSSTVSEYYALIPVGVIRTGLNEVRARVYPKFGKSSIIQGRNFLDEIHSDGITYPAAETDPSFNFNGDYKNTTSLYFWKFGLTAENIYVNLDSGSDISGTGTSNSPYKSIEGAIYRKWQSTGFAGYTLQTPYPNGAYFYVSGGYTSTAYIGAISATAGSNQYPILGFTGTSSSTDTKYIHPPVVFVGVQDGDLKPWFWGVNHPNYSIGITTSNNLVTRPVLSSWRNFIFGPNGDINKFSGNNGATLAFIENIWSGWNKNIRSYRNFRNCDFINGAHYCTRTLSDGTVEPADYRFKMFIGLTGASVSGTHPIIRNAATLGVTAQGEFYRSGQLVYNIGTTFGNNGTALKLPNNFQLTFAPSSNKLYKRDSIFNCKARGPRVNIDAYYIRNYDFKYGFSNGVLSKGILTSSTFKNFGNAIKTSFNDDNRLPQTAPDYAYQIRDFELFGVEHLLDKDESVLMTGDRFDTSRIPLPAVWNYGPDKSYLGAEIENFLDYGRYTNEYDHINYNGPDNIYVYAPKCVNGVTGSLLVDGSSPYVRHTIHNLSPSIISNVTVNNFTGNTITKLGRFGRVMDYTGSYIPKGNFSTQEGVDEFVNPTPGITFVAYLKDGMTGMPSFSHLAVVNTSFSGGYPATQHSYLVVGDEPSATVEIPFFKTFVIRNPTTFYIGGDASIVKNIYISNVDGKIYNEDSAGMYNISARYQRPCFFNNVYLKNCIHPIIEDGYARLKNVGPALQSAYVNRRVINAFFMINGILATNAECTHLAKITSILNNTNLLYEFYNQDTEQVNPLQKTRREFMQFVDNFVPNPIENNRTEIDLYYSSPYYAKHLSDMKYNVYVSFDNPEEILTTYPPSSLVDYNITGNSSIILSDTSTSQPGTVLTANPKIKEARTFAPPNLQFPVTAINNNLETIAFYSDLASITYEWRRDGIPIIVDSSITYDEIIDDSYSNFSRRFDYTEETSSDKLIFDRDPGGISYGYMSNPTYAVNKTYTLTENDVGHDISCVIKYTHFDGKIETHVAHYTPLET